ARFSTSDPANALPTPDEAGDPAAADLALLDPAVLEMTAERKIEMALELEHAALAYDPRIRRTDGAHVSSGDGTTVIANSHGLKRAASGASVSAWVAPLADDRDGRQQSGSYGMTKRRLADLATPE